MSTPEAVVITGALEHWPARSKWTLDYFQDQYGDLPLKVDGRDLSMAQLIAEARASTPDAPAPYLRNYPVTQLPEALQADVAPMPSCTGPNWLDHPLITARASLDLPRALYRRQRCQVSGLALRRLAYACLPDANSGGEGIYRVRP